MTNYELLVSKGPAFMARVFAESKLMAIKRTCEKLGILYEVTDKTLAEVIIEHEEYLMKEVEENAV